MLSSTPGDRAVGQKQDVVRMVKAVPTGSARGAISVENFFMNHKKEPCEYKQIFLFIQKTTAFQFLLGHRQVVA